MPKVAKLATEKIRDFSNKFDSLEIVADKLFCKFCKIEVICMNLNSIPKIIIHLYFIGKHKFQLFSR